MFTSVKAEIKMRETMISPAEMYIPPPVEANEEQPMSGEIHGANAIFNTSMSEIYTASSIGLSSERFTVVAQLSIGETDNIGTMAVLKNKQTGQVLLAGLSPQVNRNDNSLTADGTYLNLEPYQPLTIGRNPKYAADNKFLSAFLARSKFSEAPEISKEHITIMLDGPNLVVTDKSTNGTRFKGDNIALPIEGGGQVTGNVAEHTSRANLLALRKGLLGERDKVSYFGGRQVIGRDTIIDGANPSVDIRSWQAGGEAIVVDSKKYPESFNKLLKDFNKTWIEVNATENLPPEEAKLKAIFLTVSAAMKYDLAYADELSEEAAKLGGEHRKVALNSYLNDSKGVCRHMALAAAWLGNELARHGVLEGKTTTGVNQDQTGNSAHEWARYESADGAIYIIDPAMRKFAKLETLVNDKKSWDYFKPGEREKYKALKGSLAINPDAVAVSSPWDKIRKRLGR